jgi:hypothetical protein
MLEDDSTELGQSLQLLISDYYSSLAFFEINRILFSESIDLSSS